MTDRNERRKHERARRQRMHEQLLLQAEVLCDTHTEGKQTIVLSRMMNIILDIIGTRKLNSETRQALANHLTDCAEMFEGSVRLGGEEDRNVLYLDGAFRIDDLAKRIVWSDERTGQTIDADKVRKRA